MPLRILRLRGLIGSSVVRAFLVTGHVLDVLPRHALPRARPATTARCAPALAFLPWTVTVGDPLARHHRAAGRALRLDARAGRRPGHDDRRARAARRPPGIHTSFFPTIFFAYFAIGLGIGTLVHAAADDRDGRRARQRRRSGLGDHQRLPAGRRARSASPCSARSRPTTRKALAAHGHALASSLVGGYHLAFAIGAACLAVGDRDGARRAAAARAEDGRGRRGSSGPVALHRRRARATPRAPGRVAATAGHTGDRPRRTGADRLSAAQATCAPGRRERGVRSGSRWRITRSGPPRRTAAGRGSSRRVSRRRHASAASRRRGARARGARARRSSELVPRR